MARKRVYKNRRKLERDLHQDLTRLRNYETWLTNLIKESSDPAKLAQCFDQRSKTRQVIRQREDELADLWCGK